MMSQVQEKILYYNPGKAEKTLLLKSVLAMTGILVIEVRPEQVHRKVGALAGMELREEKKSRKGEPSSDAMPEDMMVLCGLSSERLEQILALLRSAQAAVALKAVLTESNCEWSFADLYQELCAERTAFLCRLSGDGSHMMEKI